MTPVLAAGALTRDEFTALFLGLGLLLLAARSMGEIARRLGQPAVLGEILAGVVLGPTVLGAVFPGLNAYLFPTDGNVAVAFNALAMVGISLFLLVAGIEVNLSMVWRHGKSALVVAVAGMVVPFALGFGGGLLMPDFFRLSDGANPFVGALFLGTALCISALPVIAKILMDLNLFRGRLGMVVVAAAIVNDLLGWIAFAFILGMMPASEAAQAAEAAGGSKDTGFGVGTTIVLTVLFVGLILTVGRWAVDRSLPWVQAHLSWPGGIIGTVLGVGLLCAAMTEWIGIHAIFGAFLFGVALGDSPHLREQTRATLDQFISFFFAPLFFASIGLTVNFISSFDVWLVLGVMVIATAGKVLGCGLGARWSGFNSRESWAIGFGMNARGAMEIILGLLALQAGVIGERLFVALVVMALATSVLSGTIMQRILGTRPKPPFTSYLTSRRFVRPLLAGDRRAAVAALAEASAQSAMTPSATDYGVVTPDTVLMRVWARRTQWPADMPEGLAVADARVPGLKAPVIAVGVNPEGVDFGQRDTEQARLIFLVLTPFDQPDRHEHLLSELKRTFANREVLDKAAAATTYTQFLAVVKSDSPTMHVESVA